MVITLFYYPERLIWQWISQLLLLLLFLNRSDDHTYQSSWKKTSRNKTVRNNDLSEYWPAHTLVERVKLLLIYYVNHDYPRNATLARAIKSHHTHDGQEPLLTFSDLTHLCFSLRLMIFLIARLYPKQVFISSALLPFALKLIRRIID